MKKTNLIILIILLVLLGVIGIINLLDRPPKDRVFRDFSVEDTAAVNKIFLADKQDQTLLLERQSDHWTVNGEYTARKDFVNLLLSTFKRMEVSAPVPKARLDYVLRSIAGSGIKCEIYKNDRLYKTYYVGGVTEDNTGTYMIMENSDVPFVVHIPGFSGYLTVRYLPVLNEWRERIVFNYDVRDMHKVYLEYPDEPGESFIAVNHGNNKFDLKNINGESVSFDFDTMLVKQFISQTKFVGFESFIREELREGIIDSLKSEPMVNKFTVETFDGDKKSMKTYHRPNIDQAVDDEGVLYDFDLDKLYAVIEDGNQVVIIQYYIIDPISYKMSYFNPNLRRQTPKFKKF